jgi:hypothetical protein
MVADIAIFRQTYEILFPVFYYYRKTFTGRFFLSIIARSRMKELFNYSKAGFEKDASQILILKVGERLRSAVVTDATWSQLYQVMYSKVEPSTDLNWRELESKYSWVSSNYSKVHIVVDYPNSLLVPDDRNWKEDAAILLNNMNGYCENEMILEERLPGHEARILYTVPNDTYNWLREKFPHATWNHARTLALMKLSSEEGGALLLDFDTTTFSLVAARKDAFLLTRIYDYSTPEDVLFYLLQACRYLSLKPTEVSLGLTGLVDKDSALYKELFQYFIHVTLREAEWKDDTGLPSHFFTSFKDVSVCVS